MNAQSASRSAALTTDVVVVGAGHSGLAMSQRLTASGVDHVVLEKHVAGGSWQTRWDSLRLLTPNWMLQLPGLSVDPRAPDHPRDGFMHKSDVARFVRDYAHGLAAPVREGVEVLEARPQGLGWRLRTNQGAIDCRALVHAGGAFARAARPALSSALPRAIHQLDAGQYRNPDQLPDGAVLVVGASATGLQLAREIAQSGRQVLLSVGEHVRMPRSYRGRDIYWWLEASGINAEAEADVDDVLRARNLPSPQLVGESGCNLDINAMQAMGVEIAGRLAGCRDGVLQFSGGLANTCKSADLKQARMLARFEQWAQLHPEACPIAPAERPAPTVVNRPRLSLDLASGEVRSVVWATGFHPDNQWLPGDLLDARGRVPHRSGVADAEGLFLLGLPFMRNRASSFIFGAASDTAFILRKVQTHLNATAPRQPNRADAESDRVVVALPTRGVGARG